MSQENGRDYFYYSANQHSIQMELMADLVCNFIRQRAAEVGYPKRLKTEYAFKEGLLEISFDDRPQARIFELRY